MIDPSEYLVEERNTALKPMQVEVIWIGVELKEKYDWIMPSRQVEQIRMMGIHSHF